MNATPRTLLKGIQRDLGKDSNFRKDDVKDAIKGFLGSEKNFSYEENNNIQKDLSNHAVLANFNGINHLEGTKVVELNCGTRVMEEVSREMLPYYTSFEKYLICLNVLLLIGSLSTFVILFIFFDLLDSSIHIRESFS